MNTATKCEHVLELLTDPHPSQIEVDLHLANCKSCREIAQEIGPAMEWLTSLEDSAAENVDAVMHDRESRIRTTMRSIRRAANENLDRMPHATIGQRDDRPGAWQKTLVALAAIATAVILALVLSPGSGQAAKSPETYLTGMGVPDKCVTLVCGDAGESSKVHDCCTECHVATSENRMGADKTSVVIGSCLACHTR
ncbi:MAG: hypothetical protein AAF497_15220 [Planctomycetota bacterium]